MVDALEPPIAAPTVDNELCDMVRGPPDDDEPVESGRSLPTAGGPDGRASGVLREVEEFVDRYGLSHKRKLFQKAAVLLQDDVDEEQVSEITLAERTALSRESSHKWHQPRTLYFTIFICALGAIEQGWAQTAMNGANVLLADAFRMGFNYGTDGYKTIGWVNAVMYLSNALCGAWSVHL